MTQASRHATLRAGLIGLIGLAAITSQALGRDGVNQRVSLRSDGTEANGRSEACVITPDGVWIAFASEASNLVAGDSNDLTDVFVHSRLTRKTVRVSVGSGGVEGDGDSGVVLADTDGGKPAAITPNGRFVVFHSGANNLVAADINTSFDVFLHDRDPDGNGVFDEGNGACELISVDSAGLQPLPLPYASFSPTISDDGRYVAFQSKGRLVSSSPGAYHRVFVRDRLLGQTFAANLSSAGAWGDGDSIAPAISGDGRTVTFASKAKKPRHRRLQLRHGHLRP